MPHENPNAKVRFLGGASPRRNLFGVLAYPEALDGTDMEFTRFYMVKDGKWVHREFESDVVSVCYFSVGNDRGWWLLGKRGDVTSITASGHSTDSIPTAGTGPGKLGYVKKIRVIGDAMYAAGYRRQVYRRTEGQSQWTPISGPIHADRKRVGFVFNDIDGTSEQDIYAVGNRGEIFHFDGTSWIQIESPTNVHLESVACFDKHAVVAGRNGVILLGDVHGFNAVGPAMPDLNFWDACVFSGRVFVVASRGVFEMRLTGDHDLIASPFPPHVGYKLGANEEVLYSFGTHQVFCYDGSSVAELICPDNS